jgi:hypothetical protein
MLKLDLYLDNIQAVSTKSLKGFVFKILNSKTKFVCDSRSNRRLKSGEGFDHIILLERYLLSVIILEDSQHDSNMSYAGS